MKPPPLSQPGITRTALRSAVVLVLLLAGCTPSVPSADPSPSATIPPSATSATSATASPSTSAIDTSNWTVYRSKRYRFNIKHPPGWKVVPAERDWKLEADADKPGGAGAEGFSAHDVPLYVTVWSTPAKDTPETLDGVAAWVEKYCQQAGNPCPGMQDQAVPLCNETDCHSGLLVGWDGLDFEAFFTGGKHEGQMVGVTVWIPEGGWPVAKYGGARRLLEGFLSGMDVCPARPDQSQPGCP